MRTEPIRWTALLAGLLAAVGPALVSVSNGTPVLEAAGVALVAFGLVVGGGELARTQAWSPQGHEAKVREVAEVRDQYLGAEEIIAAADEGRSL